MASSYSPHLYLEKHAAGDDDWDVGMHRNLDVISRVAAPSYVFWVSPSFTPANLNNASASDRRHFPTIQEAIDAVEALSPSYGQKYTIAVYPGEYAENLVLTRSVSIVPAINFFPCFGLGGGQGVKISGGASTLAPLVTIDPVEGEFHSFTLAGLFFENAYSVASGVLDHAYAVEVLAQTVPGAYPTRVYIEHCVTRAQAAGAGQKWTACFRARGWTDLFFNDTFVRCTDYTGGTYDGGIRTLIYHQVSVGSNDASVRLIGGSFENIYGGSDYCRDVHLVEEHSNFYMMRSNLAISAPNCLPSTRAHLITGIIEGTLEGWVGSDPVDGYFNSKDKWITRI